MLSIAGAHRGRYNGHKTVHMKGLGLRPATLRGGPHFLALWMLENDGTGAEERYACVRELCGVYGVRPLAVALQLMVVDGLRCEVSMRNLKVLVHLEVLHLSSCRHALHWPLYNRSSQNAVRGERLCHSNLRQ